MGVALLRGCELTPVAELLPLTACHQASASAPSLGEAARPSKVDQSWEALTLGRVGTKGP